MRLPWREEILRGILGADVVGMQRRGAAENLVQCSRRLLDAQGAVPGLTVDGRRIEVGAFPISIDVAEFEELAARPRTRAHAERLRARLGDPDVVLLGIDRLDYTKGIDVRLEAFRDLLASGDLDRRRCALVQVAVPTRERLEHYADERRRVEQLVGEINGEFSRLGYPVVHYLHQNVPMEELSALYQVGDVMLVTPLRDGMNLVAKEYAASRVDGGGVLVLSEFAGAADELGDALARQPPRPRSGPARRWSRRPRWTPRRPAVAWPPSGPSCGPTTSTTGPRASSAGSTRPWPPEPSCRIIPLGCCPGGRGAVNLGVSDGQTELVIETGRTRHALPTDVVRSPSDVLRLAVGAVLLLALLLVQWLWGETLVTFASELFEGLSALPSWLVGVVVAGTRVLAVVVLVGGLVLTVRAGGARMVGTAAAAAGVALVLQLLLERLGPDAGTTALDVPDALGPLLEGRFPADRRSCRRGGRRHRRRPVAEPPGPPPRVAPGDRPRRHPLPGHAGVVRLAPGLARRLGGGRRRPRRARRARRAARPGSRARPGWRAVGVPLASLDQASVDARGSTPYFGAAADGQKLFVKALGRTSAAPTCSSAPTGGSTGGTGATSARSPRCAGPSSTRRSWRWRPGSTASARPASSPSPPPIRTASSSPTRRWRAGRSTASLPRR